MKPALFFDPKSIRSHYQGNRAVQKILQGLPDAILEDAAHAYLAEDAFDAESPICDAIVERAQDLMEDEDDEQRIRLEMKTVSERRKATKAKGKR